MIDGAVPNYVPNIGHKEDAGSVWGDIATFLPYTLYTYFGNQEEMNYCYPLMKDWEITLTEKTENEAKSTICSISDSILAISWH